jgi:hypothetical protein
MLDIVLVVEVQVWINGLRFVKLVHEGIGKMRKNVIFAKVERNTRVKHCAHNV